MKNPGRGGGNHDHNATAESSDMVGTRMVATRPVHSAMWTSMRCASRSWRDWSIVSWNSRRCSKISCACASDPPRTETPAGGFKKGGGGGNELAADD